MQIYADEAWDEVMETRRRSKWDELRGQPTKDGKIRTQPPPNLKETVAREFFQLLPTEEREVWEAKAKLNTKAASTRLPSPAPEIR